MLCIVMSEKLTQNRVDARPLLEQHGEYSETDTTEHRLCLEKRADSDELQFDGGHCRSVGQMRKALSGGPFLEQGLGFDFQKFELDEFVVFWQVSKAGECLAGFGFPSVMAQPSWAEGHEDLCWSAKISQRSGLQDSPFRLREAPLERAGATVVQAKQRHADLRRYHQCSWCRSLAGHNQRSWAFEGIMDC